MATTRTKQLKQHGQMLRRLGHRCQYCGRGRLGHRLNGRYQPYNFHHSDSAAYKHEILGWNLLLLCKPCHAKVHRLGGESLTKGAVLRQKACSKFPNGPQQFFNWTCRLRSSAPFLIGWLALGCIILVT